MHVRSAFAQVSLPPDINAYLEQLSGILTLGIQGFATSGLSCFGLDGYFYQLLFWMVLPVVLVLLVIIGVVVSSALKKRKKKLAVAATSTKEEESHGGGFHLYESDEPERAASFFEKTLPAVLTLLFFLYPVVTKNAFDGFPCYTFTNGRGWLMADVSIECATSVYVENGPFFEPQPGAFEHGMVRSVAWVAVIIYPIGIWAFCAMLLLKASTAILEGKETPLTRAIGFLYREYDTTCFWWELLEMLRKFLLVGLFVTVMPGTIMQISMGTIVCAVYLVRTASASAAVPRFMLRLMQPASA